MAFAAREAAERHALRFSILQQAQSLGQTEVINLVRRTHEIIGGAAKNSVSIWEKGATLLDQENNLQLWRHFQQLVLHIRQGLQPDPIVLRHLAELLYIWDI